MPRNYKTVYTRQMDKYLSELKERNRSPRTIDTYRSILTGFQKRLSDQGIHPRPLKITKEDFMVTLEARKEDVSISTYQFEAKIIKTFLTWAENPEMTKVYLNFQKPPRPNAHWLQESEVISYLGAIETPMEEMITHLLLEMWLRSIGSRNLKYPESFQNNTVTVLSKGRKWRTLPFHPMTRTVLERYLPYRDSLIAKAKDQAIPDNLLLTHSYRWGLVPASKTKIYNTVRGIGERAGLEVSPHTLRRTGARLTYFNLLQMNPQPREPPLITVSKMLGHASINMTIEYLGIDLVDMSEVYRNASMFRPGTKTAISYPETSEPAIL